MAKSAIARALDKLFESKNPDGSDVYTIIDVHAVRAFILIEMGRREELHLMTYDQKVEFAQILDLIGIKPDTDPSAMMGLVTDYFTKLKFNPMVLVEMFRIFEKFGTKGDRVEAMKAIEKAFDKLHEKDTSRVAPKVGEKAPENSEHAQTLTFKLGGKVRI